MRVSGKDLRLLQVFEAVARHGSFSGAATDLNIGQPTVSNHMTALEERLGIVLCHRGRRGFRLTEKGRAVLEASERLEKALQDFTTEVASVRGELRGELRVAILDAIATDPHNRLAEIVAEFGRIAPNVSLILAQERPQDMQQKVLDGVYHCAIGSSRQRIDGIVYDRLYDERHSLYCGRTHEAFETPDHELTEDVLAAMPFVHRGYWRDDDKLRSMTWNQAATVYEIEPQFILIESGRFIGLLPDHYARSHVEAGRLRAIRPNEIFYDCTFELFTPARQRGSEIGMAFVEVIEHVRGVTGGDEKAAASTTPEPRSA